MQESTESGQVLSLLDLLSQRLNNRRALAIPIVVTFLGLQVQQSL
jgi:hypothetical protein